MKEWYLSNSGAYETRDESARGSRMSMLTKRASVAGESFEAGAFAEFKLKVAIIVAIREVFE